MAITFLPGDRVRHRDGRVGTVLAVLPSRPDGRTVEVRWHVLHTAEWHAPVDLEHAAGPVSDGASP